MEMLQAAASLVIADIAESDAAYVTVGAVVEQTIATAACITGLDITRMDRLPDTAEKASATCITGVLP